MFCNTLIFCITLLFVQAANAQVNKELYIPNTTPNDIELVDNTLYMAGGFDVVGPYSGGAAFFDLNIGNWLDNYPKINGNVTAAISDGNGGWYVAGDFISAAEQQKFGLVHVTGDGTLDDWTPRIEGGEVRSMLLWDNRLYIGGDFTMVDSIDRMGLACFSLDSLELTDWDPQAVRYSFNGTVHKILPRESTLLVLGIFTNIGGQDRFSMAELDTVSGMATDWDPQNGQTNFGDQIIFDGIVHDGRLFLAGSFVGIADSSREYFAQIDMESEKVTALKFDFYQEEGPAGLYDIEIINNVLYMAGGYSSVNETSRTCLAAWDINNNSFLDWAPQVGGFETLIESFSVYDNTMFVAGDFKQLGGMDRNYLGAVSMTDGSVTDWNPVAGYRGTVLAHDEETLFAGGRFRLMNGASREGLAAFNIADSKLLDISIELSGRINDVIVVDQTLYIGGSFWNINGEERRNLASINLSDGSLTDWAPEPNSTVEALAYGNNRLFVGGGFNEIGGQERGYLVSFDASGNLESWDPQPQSSVRSMSLHDNTLYVAGWFNNIGGQSRKYVAGVDIVSGNANALNPEPNSSPNTLMAYGNTLYIGGNFSEVAGKDQASFAAFSLSDYSLKGDVAPQFLLEFNGNSSRGTVYAIFQRGEEIHVGGSFNRLGESVRNGFAVIDSVGGNPRPTTISLNNEQANAVVRELIVSDQGIIIAGDYNSAGLTGTSRLTHIDTYPVGLDDVPSFVPQQITLFDNYPNPFNPQTTIEFSINKSTRVDLAVYDMLGREVAQLLNQSVKAGQHAVTFRGDHLASGLYIYRLTTAAKTISKKMLLLK